MNKHIKKMMIQSVLGLMLILSITLYSYPHLVANWRECLNTPGCSCTLQGTTLTLKIYVTESAGYLLNSHSAYQTFLNRVEMADVNGIDFTELKDILYNAVSSMEKAKAAYTKVKAASEKIPMDTIMISKLQNFDYDDFQAKYGLIKPIFVKVKKLLLKGDIPGLDATVLANMENILKQLYEVKAFVDKSQMPEISILWRLNQSYAEAQLFGQYIAQIIKANL